MMPSLAQMGLGSQIYATLSPIHPLQIVPVCGLGYWFEYVEWPHHQATWIINLHGNYIYKVPCRKELTPMFELSSDIGNVCINLHQFTQGYTLSNLKQETKSHKHLGCTYTLYCPLSRTDSYQCFKACISLIILFGGIHGVIIIGSI